ncbi:hypothetical protein SN13T_0074 [Lactiplantibacillus plantarum]|nr:hypothetical protein SN13T_0074 [Lactiplantibacillus plantarum]
MGRKLAFRCKYCFYKKTYHATDWRDKSFWRSMHSCVSAFEGHASRARYQRGFKLKVRELITGVPSVKAAIQVNKD